MGTDASKAESKASMLRGYIAVLEGRGLLDKVRARVTPDVRALLDQPPPASAWVRGAQMEQIGEATIAIVGMPTWRTITREAVLEGLVPIIRSMVEGLLRLFGGTPATLFSRIEMLTKNTSRGSLSTYRVVSPTSGVMTVTIPGRTDVPMQVWMAHAGGLEATFDLCGVEGRSEEPVVVEGSEGRTAEFRLSWSVRNR